MMGNTGDRRNSDTRMLERRMSNNQDDLNSNQKINYILEWFNQWSDLQKSDFVIILSDQVTVKTYLLSNKNKEIYDKLGIFNMSKGDVVRSPPSIFACQCKLFREWFSGWSDDQKNYLVMRLQAIDGEFYAKYEKYVSDPEAVSKGQEKDYFEPGVPPEMVRKSSRSVLGPHSMSPTPPAVGYSSNNFSGVSSIQSARPATIEERSDSLGGDEENCMTDELKNGNPADSDGNLESDSELKEINSYCGQDPDGDTDTNYQKQLTTIAE